MNNNLESIPFADIQSSPSILIDYIKNLFKMLKEVSQETCKELNERVNILDGNFDEI